MGDAGSCATSNCTSSNGLAQPKKDWYSKKLCMDSEAGPGRGERVLTNW
jgi:hypothetical protein